MLVIRVILKLKQWLSLEVMFSRKKGNTRKNNELPESDQ